MLDVMSDSGKNGKFSRKKFELFFFDFFEKILENFEFFVKFRKIL